MSKAVTNEEVEDVLSSIRRLVSEDKRPLAGLRSAPFAAPVADEVTAEQEEGDETPADEQSVEETLHEAERFVLTPSFRVLTPEADAADEGPLDLGSVARETWTQDIDENPVEEAGASDDNAPMVLFPEAKVPDQDDAMDALDALVHDAIESEVKDLEEAVGAGDYADEGFWDDADDDASPQVTSDADRSHEERSDDSHTFEDNDHFEYEENWNLGDEEPAHADAAEDSSEDKAEVEEAPFFEGAPEIASEPLDVASGKRAPYIPLTAKIAALEAVIGGKHQDYEPDGDEKDELASPGSPAMAWEDDVELDAKGEPFVAPPEQDVKKADDHNDAAPEREAAPQGAAFAADDQLIDEESLRDLVSEIVRAELQGALGERITRNVRKLVRREIHRALTAQEME
ncbi:hypothetical protein [Sulfitobacter sp.]|uniref:hypothetical protein n=1 Tax=Sulfitobacter sp. TaxID=1903071 RepID=UPI003EFB00BA